LENILSAKVNNLDEYFCTLKSVFIEESQIPSLWTKKKAVRICVQPFLGFGPGPVN